MQRYGSSEPEGEKHRFTEEEVSEATTAVLEAALANAERAKARRERRRRRLILLGCVAISGFGLGGMLSAIASLVSAGGSNTALAWAVFAASFALVLLGGLLFYRYVLLSRVRGPVIEIPFPIGPPVGWPPPEPYFDESPPGGYPDDVEDGAADFYDLEYEDESGDDLVARMEPRGPRARRRPIKAGLTSLNRACLEYKEFWDVVGKVVVPILVALIGISGIVLWRSGDSEAEPPATTTTTVTNVAPEGP